VQTANRENAVTKKTANGGGYRKSIRKRIENGGGIGELALQVQRKR
jgi:hypothetical protein